MFISKIVDLVLNYYGKIPYLVQYFIIPLFFIFLLWKGRNKCKLDWLIKVLVISSYMLVLLYAAAIDTSIGYYTYYILLILLIIAIVISFRKIKRTKFFNKKSVIGWSGYILGIIAVLVCTYLNIGAVSSCIYNEKAIELKFPFKNGVYLIDQGGDGEKSSSMNYHYLDKMNNILGYNTSTRYANDIVKINNFGFSVNSFNPWNKALPDLNSYEIFGETIYSPCDGYVYYLENEFEDLPASFQKQYLNTGNGVVIKYNDIYVMMWHLKQGSITVKTGDYVKAGQQIGQVGNTGHTSHPHLHIQAAKDDWLYGKSVPVLFDNRVPIKHSLFVR